MAKKSLFIATQHTPVYTTKRGKIRDAVETYILISAGFLLLCLLMGCADLRAVVKYRGEQMDRCECAPCWGSQFK